MVDERREENKQYVQDYLAAHPCVVCGEDRVPTLVFHHRDPSTKLFSVSQYGRRPLFKIQEEIDKCDVLCANCHAMWHHKHGR